MVTDQYQIVLVNFNPSTGSEISKTRPALVLSPSSMNKHLNTVIVAPMTSTKRDYPTRVHIRSDKNEGYIALDQIRTIDHSRIYKSFKKIKKKEIENVKSVLSKMLVE